MIVLVPFEVVGFIFLVLVLLAIGGIQLVVNHLYNIVLAMAILMGLCFLIGEIVNAISKKRPIYILNGLFGGTFFLFGFELLYETMSLISGSVHLLKATIIYAIICVVLTIIIFASHKSEEKLRYKILSLIHCVLILFILWVIPFAGVKKYSQNEANLIFADENSELEVLQDSEIYIEVDLSSGNRFDFSWYPIDIQMSFGTFKKGTCVYFSGDEYGEYYKVTDGKKVGYVKKENLREH